MLVQQLRDLDSKIAQSKHELQSGSIPGLNAPIGDAPTYNGAFLLSAFHRNDRQVALRGAHDGPEVADVSRDNAVVDQAVVSLTTTLNELVGRVY